AHRSTTWPPFVLTTRIDCPALSETAAPRRAGISISMGSNCVRGTYNRAMNLFEPATYAGVRRPLLEAETLPVGCYTSEEFFKREVETIFMKVWNFIGRADYIPKAGDFYTVTFAGVPLLLVRGDDGAVQAFVNSCRHRGAKVASGQGNAFAFKCPYHGWVYDKQGQLTGCPGMESARGFERKDYPLVPMRTETWAGSVFVNFDPDAVGLTEYLGNIDSY